METKIKSASVKVMLSYDYSHFETSMSLENEEGLLTADVDNARKDCQRLCDKAVKQYQTAKKVNEKRTNLHYEKENLEREVRQIQQKSESDWTVTDKAKIKALADHDWNMRYDYEDDYEPNY